MKFDLPKDHSSIIKVIGVGGGGTNAVNHMYERGIQGVDFMICNTDAQSLDKSPVPIKLQLGQSLTEGRGAGSIPDVGRNAAIESIDDVKEVLEKNTTMVFITAGMGGGTGTGAAPVIAQAARELGVLTVGIVTVPFMFEGRKRRDQAERGLEEMRNSVDTLLVIQNDKLREAYGNLSLKEAFSKADDVLTTAAKGIAEVVSITGEINVDMNDVQTVMKDSGAAIMGSGTAQGDDRALKAVQTALESPLLNDNDISGAQFVLLNITYGNQDIMMDEIATITDYIQEAAGSTADVIWGYAIDEELGENISVTVIATGFQANNRLNNPDFEEAVVKRDLDEDVKPVRGKISNPFESSGDFQSTSKKTVEDEPYIVSQKDDTPEEPKVDDRAVSEDEGTSDAEEITFRIRGKGQDTPDQSVSNINTTESSEGRQEGFAEEQKPVKKTFLLLDDDDELEELSEKHTNERKEEVPTHNAQQEPRTEEKPEEQPDLFTREKKSAAQEQEFIEQRLNKIKEMSIRMRTPGGLAELENEPAFVRKQFKFKKDSDDQERSNLSLDSDNFVSRNNSYLHDNVD